MRFAFITIILVVILLAWAPSNSTSTPVVIGASSNTPSSTPAPEITATRAVPSITNTNTAVVRNTPTAKPTKTRTLVSVLTPATLSFTQSETYALQEWTPAQADLLIDQITRYLIAIENKPEYVGVYGYSYYMEQYKYLAFIESEALLKFPDAQQAERWQWDLCYNLALSYIPSESTNAPELACYSKLIENGLNTGKTDIANVSNWFHTQESHVPFEIASATPPSGYTNSYIIVLEHNAVIWLLDKNGIFNAAGLMTRV